MWLIDIFGRLHPVMVHFPVSLILVVAILEFIDRKKGVLRGANRLLMAISAASALLSVLMGLALAESEEMDGSTLELHKWFGIATLLVSGISWYFLYKGRIKEFRVSLALAVILVGVAGHLGGELTHGENYFSEVIPFFQKDSVHTSGNFALASYNGTLDEVQIQELNLQVRTILAHNCYNCHGEAKSKGDLKLNSKEGVFKGGKSGAVLVAGNSGKSELIRRISLPDGHKELMPTKGKRLSSDEVAILKLWIDKGAPWPDKEKSIYRIAPLLPRLPDLPPATKDIQQPIDRIVNQYFQANQIVWTSSVEDRVYIRRVYLDIIGLLPPPQEVDQFLADKDPKKREKLAETLLSRNDDYAQHWLTFWNDQLRNDYTGTGYITGGRFDITRWLYNSLEVNKPYNWFVKELLNPNKDSEGFIRGIEWRGTVNSSQTTQMQAAQNVAQVFLGLNLKCASCHDSFISDWKLEDAYGFASIFSDKPLEISRCDVPTGKVSRSKMLFAELGEITQDAPPPQKLKELADFITQPKDGRLYRTLVNRVWAQLMGRGIIEPVDEMDNVPWSEDLLDWLAYDFVETGYDVKKLILKIVTSKTYQLPSVPLRDPNQLGTGGFQFKGMVSKRMTAEQFSDAVSQSFAVMYNDTLLATRRLPEDIKSKIPFVRASLVVNDAYQTALGRPNRETVSTSRASQMNLLQALELTNGNRLYITLKNGSKVWVKNYPNWSDLTTALFRNAYGRNPKPDEVAAIEKVLKSKKPTEEGVQDLVWSMLLSPEFQQIY